MGLSEPVKDLIRKILTVDPQYRYTIDEIRKHPWMTMNCSNRKVVKGIKVGYNQIPVDPKVLSSLTELAVDVEKTQNCLEANRHNDLTTTYYLSFKKFIKEGG